MASSISTMAVAPSVQLPLMPVMEDHQAAGLTVFGPITVENLQQIPFFASQLPEGTDPNLSVCISIENPSYCKDLDILGRQSLDDLEKCTTRPIVTDCHGKRILDDFHTGDDSTVASNAQDDDSDTEAEDELDSDDDEDIFTGPQ